MQLGLAAPLAIVAAAGFAASAVLQQQSAQKEPASASLHLRLLLALARRPLWLASLGTMVLAYVTEAVALFYGNVAFVEPLIAMELVFALPFAARAQRRLPGVREWLGAIGVVAGVGIFLAIAQPHGGMANPRPALWILMAVPCAVAILLLVLAASGPLTRQRATLLAAGAGLCFAVLALLTKSVTFLVNRGISGALTTWQPYALVGVGAVGFLFSQSAYQAGSLELSLPVIDTVEPSVAVLLGILVFHERLPLDASSMLAEVIGAVLAVSGVTTLGRSALILDAYRGTSSPTAGEANGNEVAAA